MTRAALTCINRNRMNARGQIAQGLVNRAVALHAPHGGQFGRADVNGKMAGAAAIIARMARMARRIIGHAQHIGRETRRQALDDLLLGRHLGNKPLQSLPERV